MALNLFGQIFSILAGSMLFSTLLFIYLFYIVGGIHAGDVVSMFLVSARTFFLWNKRDSENVKMWNETNAFL